MIERSFELRTDRFNSTVRAPHFINDRCFGEDFAAWLREQLIKRDACASQPIQEDFGWVLLVPRAGSTFTLAIGIADESIGETPALWLVTIAYERAINSVRSWFRPVPHNHLAELARNLEEILLNEPSFHNVSRLSEERS